MLNNELGNTSKEKVEVACRFTGHRSGLACESIVMVTARVPPGGMYHEFNNAPEELADSGIKSVCRIGGCLALSTIAVAVYSGDCCARDLDEPGGDGVPFRRELTALGPH